jgi:hypothetical protein
MPITPAATAPLDLSDWEGTPPGIRLSTTSSNKAIAPTIAYSPDGSTLAVVYLHHTGSFYTPYVRISTNDGVSWTSPTRVVPGSTVNSTALDVTVDANSKVHLVWLENSGLGQPTTLYYANNVSGSWAVQTLSQTTSAFGAAMVAPRIVASSNNRLDVVWSQVFPEAQTQLNILHKRSPNGGSSWSSNPNPVAITAPNSFSPALAITPDGKLHVVWEEAIIEPPNNEFSRIRYARGTVVGTNTTSSWEFNAANPINIADPSVDEAARPAIVAQGNTLYVSYSYRYGGVQPGDPVFQELYLTSCSADCTNQASWISDPDNPISGGPVGVNTQDPFFLIPSMVTYGNCLAAYFHGLDGDPNHALEVIWGTNRCTGWGSDLDQATNFNTRALYPRMATDGSWLHLVYELRNQSTGDIQIYYRRRVPPQPELYLPLVMRS